MGSLQYKQKNEETARERERREEEEKRQISLSGGISSGGEKERKRLLGGRSISLERQTTEKTHVLKGIRGERRERERKAFSAFIIIIITGSCACVCMEEDFFPPPPPPYISLRFLDFDSLSFLAVYHMECQLGQVAVLMYREIGTHRRRHARNFTAWTSSQVCLYSPRPILDPHISLRLSIYRSLSIYRYIGVDRCGGCPGGRALQTIL